MAEDIRYVLGETAGAINNHIRQPGSGRGHHNALERAAGLPY
jgi:hypothetical protein